MPRATRARWLLLIHQIPPKPGYLRVKVWRRLLRLGAVGLKNSVYALPRSDQAREDFEWVRREIVTGGGDATVCEARLVEGLSDGDVEALFHAARSADYEELAKDARRLLESLARSPQAAAELRAQVRTELGRLQRRLGEISAIDFFGAPAREAVEGLVEELEEKLQAEDPAARSPSQVAEKPHGRTWVTRKGVHIDRIACAWLVRRFLDPEATFEFVQARGYRARPGEIRFDMYEAEFTHEGDRCSFEVLLDRFAIGDPALHAIAEIVHDIDLKDSKFECPETPGIDRLITGLCAAHRDDEARIARGSALLDDLYEAFRRSRT